MRQISGDGVVRARLGIYLSDVRKRSHWERLLGSTEFPSRAQGFPELQALDVEHFESLDDAVGWMAHGMAQDRGGILLSDALIRPDATWRPSWRRTSALNEIASGLSQQPYVSILVADDPCRPPDVDLVLPGDCSLDAWTAGLRLLTQRLEYYMPPPRDPTRVRPKGVEIRALRSTGDLRDALALRRSVYEVMGYLDDEFLATGSMLELSWCDRISRHFGVFVPSTEDSRPRLVGTARLILTKGYDNDVDSWYQQIALSQPRLRTLVERQRLELAQFKLPVFNTFPLNTELQLEACSDSPWAELSRVVVNPKWRGYGFARDLVEASLREAARLRVEHVFLECLAIHAPMYEARGFLSIGQRGAVMRIGKTMVGMRRQGAMVRPAPQNGGASRDTQEAQGSSASP